MNWSQWDLSDRRLMGVKKSLVYASLATTTMNCGAKSRTNRGLVEDCRGRRMSASYAGFRGFIDADRWIGVINSAQLLPKAIGHRYQRRAHDRDELQKAVMNATATGSAGNRFSSIGDPSSKTYSKCRRSVGKSHCSYSLLLER